MSELRSRTRCALNEMASAAGAVGGGDRVIEAQSIRAIVARCQRASTMRRTFAIAARFKSTLTRHDRYRISHRAADLIRERSTEISDLITAESGLCKKDSLYEVGRACDVFVFAGNAALTDDGQIFSCDLTPHGKKRKVYTLREPLQGAIAAITPFNHPLNQVAHKVAPRPTTGWCSSLRRKRR